MVKIVPDTNFEEIAQDRINHQLSGFKEIKSKEEYFEKLENYLGASKSGQSLLNAKSRSWNSIREEMFGGEASDVVAKNQERLSESESSDLRARGLAHRFEDRRQASSRRADERKTARDVRRVSMMSYRSWRRNPTRFDLRGVDTRRARAFKKGLVVRNGRVFRYVSFINRGKRVNSYKLVKKNLVRKPFSKKR
jgi:hypothetical protein